MTRNGTTNGATTRRPRPSLWSRLVGGARHLWTGEAIGGDELGYPVHPLDLLDGGPKGIEHSLYGMLAAWRRNQGKDHPRPTHHQFSDAHVRDLARLLERYNPFCQALFSALRSYVLGEQGLAVEVTVRENVTPADDDERLKLDAQTYLDEFMDRDDWWSRERELHTRCHRDGEGILRFFADADGVRLRFVEPECVVAPDGSPEWSEGVRTDPDDAECVEAYWVQTGSTPTEGEEVSADEVYAIRCNVDRCLKRGVSDFASIANLVIKALDCATSMVGAETVRQGVTWITHHEQSSPADLDQFIAAQTDYTDRSRAYSQGGPAREVPTQAVSAVREINLTGAQKLAAAPGSGTSTDGTNAINTALLSAASRYHMPLWVISGDASRNNALDLQAEGPFGKFVKDEQAWFSRHVRNVLWRVLEIGVDRGELKAQTLVALDLAVTPQAPTEQRDPTQETARNKTLFDSGILGKPDWSNREGLDFQQQQDDLKRYGGPAGAEGVETDAPVEPATTEQPDPAVAAADTPGEASAASASVGGLQAILALQTSVYKGEVPRLAAIANAEVVFGFTPAEAARLFPEVPPVATADTGQGGGAAGGMAGEAEWDESKHGRDESGKFGSGGAGPRPAPGKKKKAVAINHKAHAAKAYDEPGQALNSYASDLAGALQAGKVKPAEAAKGLALVLQSAREGVADHHTAIVRDTLADWTAQYGDDLGEDHVTEQAGLLAEDLAQTAETFDESTHAVQAAFDEIVEAGAIDEESAAALEQAGIDAHSAHEEYLSALEARVEQYDEEMKDAAARAAAESLVLAEVGLTFDELLAAGRSRPRWEGESVQTYALSLVAEAARIKRKEGETWETGGRKYKVVQGKTIRVPGKKEAPAPKEKAAKKEAPPKKEKAAKLTTDQAAQAMKDAGGDPKKMGAVLAAITVPQVKELRARMGMTKGAGAKQALADELVAKVVAGQPKPEAPKPEAPKPEAKPKDVISALTEALADDPLRKATKEVEAAKEFVKGAQYPQQKDFRGVKAYQQAREAYAMKYERLKKAQDDLAAAKKAGSAASRKKLMEVLAVEKPSTFRAKAGHGVSLAPEEKATVDEAHAFLATITGGLDEDVYYFRSTDDRANYMAGDWQRGGTPGANSVSIRGGEQGQVVAHELAHMIETRKPGVRKKVDDFLEARLGGEKPIPYSQVTGNPAHAREMVRKDEFDRYFPVGSAYYVGKVYASPGIDYGRPFASEILSMGVQALYNDPAGFVEKDPEYAKFVISCLRD